MPQSLRADAQDNRDRIVAGARVLFTERGLGVGMREIARRAEVGPATLYRRFPTKQALIDVTFEIERQTCRSIVEDGCADPDPWRGLSSVIERLTVLNVGNRGFVDALLLTQGSTTTLTEHRRELLRLLAPLVERARTAGRLRPDFTIDDLVLVLLAGRGLSSVTPAARSATAQRFSALVLDGLGARTAATGASSMRTR